MNILLEENSSAVVSLAVPICALSETNSALVSLAIGSKSYLHLEFEPATLDGFRKLPLERLALPPPTFPPGLSFTTLFEVPATSKTFMSLKLVQRAQ